MMTESLPLAGPPGYEYETTGPWFVCTVLPDGETATANVQWTYESAMTRYWLVDADKDYLRKVMIDAMGYCILGRDVSNPEHPKIVGTRQTMNAMLEMIRRTPNWTLDMEADILNIIVMVEKMDGQSL